MKPTIVVLLSAFALGLVASPARAETSEGWEYVTTDNGVVVYRKKVEGTDVVAFKGVTYANLPIGKLLAVFRDPDERKHWVDRYAEHKTLEKTDTTETYWIHFALPFIVSDRDYILRGEASTDAAKKTYTVNIKSVEHKDKGEDECCVRATVHKTFYEFVALPGEDKTKITVEVHTDPKGSIPTWLVNLIQKSWPAKTLNGLINHARVSQKPVLAEYADWHAKGVAPVAAGEAAAPEAKPAALEATEPPAAAAQP